MSTTIIDFFHNDGAYSNPEYLLRLRATENGPIDLAGNTLTQHNVSYTNLGKFGQRSMTFTKGNVRNNSYISYRPTKIIEPGEDWTISLFVKFTTDPTSYHYSCIMDHTIPWTEYVVRDPGDFILFVGSYTKSLYPEIDIDTGGRYSFYGTRSSEDTGVWIHYALTMKNKICKYFRNGQLVTQVTTTNTFPVLTLTKDTYIGCGNFTGLHTNELSSLDGELDDVCIIKGKALWTENFTPPTTYLPDKI